MLRTPVINPARFALLVWFLAGMAAIVADTVLEPSQDRLATYALTDAQDSAQPSANPEHPGDDPVPLAQASYRPPYQAAHHLSFALDQFFSSKAPRIGWQGRAPPIA
jgi:hypothetical protein